MTNGERCRPTGSRESTRQAWKFVGALAVLVAVGMLGLYVRQQFTTSATDNDVSNNRVRIASLERDRRADLARIGQLEFELRSHNIPVPAAPTTTTSSVVTQRRPTTTTTTSTTRPPSTTSTTRPRTTTTTRPPCFISTPGACIGGSP